MCVAAWTPGLCFLLNPTNTNANHLFLVLYLSWWRWTTNLRELSFSKSKTFNAIVSVLTPVYTTCTENKNTFRNACTTFMTSPGFPLCGKGPLVLFTVGRLLHKIMDCLVHIFLLSSSTKLSGPWAAACEAEPLYTLAISNLAAPKYRQFCEIVFTDIFVTGIYATTVVLCVGLCTWYRV